jgi:gentisate 1,2-dioxygenase
MADNQKLFFIEDNGAPVSPPEFWPALVITSEEIEEEIARLSAKRIAAGESRRAYVVHPNSVEPGRGLAPGIDVSINVLMPGEATRPFRESASSVAFCIRGRGVCSAGATRLAFESRDVWNIPSMSVYSYENRAKEPVVFLSYSNTPILKKLGVHVFETSPEPAVSTQKKADPSQKEKATRAKTHATNESVGSEGARILGYEYLVDIDVVASRPLIWPWKEVSQHLDGVEHLGGAAGKGYRGRHLVTLYNPATERRIGTTPSFFASIAQFPPNRVDAPHRHSSAAINYIFAGDGRSTVEGRKFAWKTGDLMLSAPGWAVHNHAAGDKGCNILTVQDHPLQIAMESLIWQETLKGAMFKMGAEAGVETNIADSVAAE